MPNGSDDVKLINEALLTALIDCRAMLADFVSGRPRNWDGSTEGQARSCLRDADAAIAKARKATS